MANGSDLRHHRGLGTSNPVGAVMRQALKADGVRISIEQFKALPVVDRPALLTCPGQTPSRARCDGKAWPQALDSRKVTARFAAHHRVGCDEGAHLADSGSGDSGHDHRVVVTGVMRVNLNTSVPALGGSRKIPDPGVPGSSTRRFVPVGPGESGQSQDAVPRMRTILRDLATSGLDPDMIVECPITKDHRKASEYFLRLETARGTAGWRMFYGRIARTWINPNMGSLGMAADLNGAPPGTALDVYVPEGFLGDFFAKVPRARLAGRWILVLAEASAEKSWVTFTSLNHVALLRAP